MREGERQTVEERDTVGRRRGTVQQEEGRDPNRRRTDRRGSQSVESRRGAELWEEEGDTNSRRTLTGEGQTGGV